MGLNRNLGQLTEVIKELNGKIGIGTTTPSSLLHLYVPTGTLYQTLESNVINQTVGTITKTPSKSFFAGQNYSVANNWEVYDITSSASRLSISPAGSVGISETNPAYKLDVKSTGYNVANFNSTFGQMAISFANSGTIFSQIGSGISVTSTAAFDDLGFGTAGLNKNIVFATGTAFTERMRITSGGNVLIGTATDSGYKLEVSGTGRFIGSGFGGNGIYSTGANGGSGIYSVAGGSAGSGVYGFTNDLSSYGGTFQNSGAGAGVALRVIGFSTFSQAATFSSTISLRGDSAANNSQSTIGFTNLRSGTWNNAQIEVVTGANVWSGKLVFKTASDSFANVLTERMRIDSSYVTTSNVYESFNTESGLHFGTSGSGGSFGFIKWDAGGNYVYLGNSYNSAFNRNLVITSSGNVLIGSTSDNGNKFQVNGSITATNIDAGQYVHKDSSGVSFITYYNNLPNNSSKSFLLYNAPDSPTVGGMWTVTMVKWFSDYGSMMAINCEPNTQNMYVKTVYGGSWSGWVQK